MINPFLEINWQPNRDELRQFGRTLVIGGVILAVVFSLLSLIPAIATQTGFMAKFFGVVAIVGVVVFAIPAPAKPVYVVWFFAAACIGFVIANLLMVLFYYCFFTVIALIVRLSTGRDPLQLRRPTGDSTWVEHKKVTSAGRYYRQF